VQGAHPRLQRHAIKRSCQRIAVRAQHDPLTTAAPDPKPTIRVRTDRADPDRAIVDSGTAHHKPLEPPQFLGVYAPIHHQP
jgi:hypothetical protein